MNKKRVGRPLGYSPLAGDRLSTHLKRSNKTWVMDEELWQWLESQPNQAEVLRQAIALYKDFIEN